MLPYIITSWATCSVTMLAMCQILDEFNELNWKYRLVECILGPIALVVAFIRSW